MVFKANINQSLATLVHPNDPGNRGGEGLYSFSVKSKWRILMRGSRINTDRFPKRASRTQASREVRGMHPSEMFLISTSLSHLSWVSESFRQDIGQILV